LFGLEEASELGGDDVGVVLGPVVVESGWDDAAGVWEVLVEEVSCLGGVVRAPKELYPEVVDAREEEGGVPSRLMKTDRREAGKEGTPWWMFAGSLSGRATRGASRSMISRGRALAG